LKKGWSQIYEGLRAISLAVSMQYAFNAKTQKRKGARRTSRISAFSPREASCHNMFQSHPSALSLACLLLAAGPSWSARAQGKTEDTFVQTVTAKFFMWDSDHDNALSMEELDAAIQDPGNTGRAAAALATLKRAASVTNCTLPPLTLANIRQIANRPTSTNLPDLKRLYRQSLTRVSGLPHRFIVTSAQLFATGWPKLDAIQQGRMGDCFCLAPLGAGRASPCSVRQREREGGGSDGRRVRPGHAGGQHARQPVGQSLRKSDQRSAQLLGLAGQTIQLDPRCHCQRR
jgi:hypothetical protein